ncbi:MAG: ATP-binding protein [Bryobacteraceae bacterium]|nr:ATP-binding protein [Bryobacteraceae bacterium]
MAQTGECPLCGGTGWRSFDRDGIAVAERCGCAADERLRKIEERSNVPPLYLRASFDNFSTLPDNPVANRILTTAVTTARAYVREFLRGSTRQGLIFIGEPGTGKTHLAVAVLRSLIARFGCEGVFVDYQQLLERTRQSYDPASSSGDRGAFQTALSCEVLLLDDLGAQRYSDWVEDMVTQVVTHRCNNAKPLIATTNLRDPQAGDEPVPAGAAGDLMSRYYLSERIGMRARSRLFEMCRVISTRGAEDYRLRKRRSTATT